ncbi:MAG: 30S ribosome-binding factor RbfA [Planctomycetaceae bacterium]|jgi:ribosome-binding factor A
MSRRTAKVAEAVREVVATTILFGLKDPRVKNVTVLWADAAPDLKSVKVFISVRGEPRHAVLAMHGLESARGFIQHQIAVQLDLRYTPVLQFVLDPGAKLAAETSAVLREAMAQTAASTAEGAADAADVAANPEERDLSALAGNETEPPMPEPPMPEQRFSGETGETPEVWAAPSGGTAADHQDDPGAEPSAVPR